MPLALALYQPDIPQNCGTMLRLCACLGVEASIIEPAGFPVSDRHFRRSGMDYLDAVNVSRHVSWRAFEDWRAPTGRRLVLLSTSAALPFTDFVFAPNDILMVGRESAGAPQEVHEAADARILIRLTGDCPCLCPRVARDVFGLFCGQGVGIATNDTTCSGWPVKSDPGARQ